MVRITEGHEFSPKPDIYSIPLKYQEKSRRKGGKNGRSRSYEEIGNVAYDQDTKAEATNLQWLLIPA